MNTGSGGLGIVTASGGTWLYPAALAVRKLHALKPGCIVIVVAAWVAFGDRTLFGIVTSNGLLGWVNSETVTLLCNLS